jgi:hypothetical protein
VALGGCRTEGDMAAKRTAARLTTCLLLPAGTLALAWCSIGTRATARQAPSSADPVVQWIRQYALPLRSVDPGGPDADLAALSQMVGHASVVGLGEETHGTHEFIEVKARLTEYLISNLGFPCAVWCTDRRHGAVRCARYSTHQCDARVTAVRRRTLLEIMSSPPHPPRYTVSRGARARPLCSEKPRPPFLISLPSAARPALCGVAR